MPNPIMPSTPDTNPGPPLAVIARDLPDYDVRVLAPIPDRPEPDWKPTRDGTGLTLRKWLVVIVPVLRIVFVRPASQLLTDGWERRAHELAEAIRAGRHRADGFRNWDEHVFLGHPALATTIVQERPARACDRPGCAGFGTVFALAADGGFDEHYCTTAPTERMDEYGLTVDWHDQRGEWVLTLVSAEAGPDDAAGLTAAIADAVALLERASAAASAAIAKAA